MPFYAIDHRNTVRSDGCSMETEAQREALQNIAGLSFETVANMSSMQVSQVLKSMTTVGVRVLWSDDTQEKGATYRPARRGF